MSMVFCLYFYSFLLICVLPGRQKSRRPVYPADGITPNASAENHKAGRSSRKEPGRGGDPAAGGSGP